MDVDEILDQYQGIDAEVARAVNNRVLGAFDFSTKSNLDILITPLGTATCFRLFELQYLTQNQYQQYLDILKRPSKKESKKHPPQISLTEFLVIFDNAIELLQKEAGLVTDRWFGSKTFKAIQQLYSFEDPTEIDTWYDDNRATYFLRRCIYLRMHKYGILPGVPQRFFDELDYDSARFSMGNNIDTGYEYFRKVLKVLYLEGTDALSRLALTDTLFNTDFITHHLNRYRNKIEIDLTNVMLDLDWDTQSSHPPVTDDFAMKQLALRVLVAHSRIEAWLQGYGAKKDTKNDFNPGDKIGNSSFCDAFNNPVNDRDSIFGGIKFKPEFRRYYSLWKETSTLINTIPDDDRTDAMNVDSVNGQETIKRHIAQGRFGLATMALHTINCAAALDAVPETTVSEHARRIKEEYKHIEGNDLRVEAWKQKPGFMAIVFDGIKRAFKWLWSKVRSIFQTIKNVARRLIRLIQSLATTGFTYFKKTIQIFGDAVEFVTNRVMYNNEHAVVIRDADYDLSVLGSDNADAFIQIHAAAETITRKTTNFRAACIILNYLIKGLKILNDFISGTTGRVWKIVDAVTNIAYFFSDLTEEDRAYLDTAFENMN